MIYWMLPRLWKTDCIRVAREPALLACDYQHYSLRRFDVDCWHYAGLDVVRFDPESGLLVYNQWAEFVDAILPYHYLHALVVLFIAGFCLMLFNVLKTI